MGRKKPNSKIPGPLGQNPPDTAGAIPGIRKYPSRAAEKLLGAFEDLSASEDLSDEDRSLLSPEGMVCVDLGASHGGFSKVLKEKGALRIYAVDVAYGIFDYSLRKDPAVVVLERKNARDIQESWFLPEDLRRNSSGSGKPDLFIVSDLSFISLKTIMNSLIVFLKETRCTAAGLLLIKPQFEAGALTEKGILTDDSLRNRITEDVCSHARSLGFRVISLVPSRLKGTKGNQEYILFFSLL